MSLQGDCQWVHFGPLDAQRCGVAPLGYIKYCYMYKCCRIGTQELPSPTVETLWAPSSPTPPRSASGAIHTICAPVLWQPLHTNTVCWDVGKRFPAALWKWQHWIISGSYSTERLSRWGRRPPWRAMKEMNEATAPYLACLPQFAVFWVMTCCREMYPIP